jgi:hypothetical protein
MSKAFLPLSQARIGGRIALLAELDEPCVKIWSRNQVLGAHVPRLTQ